MKIVQAPDQVLSSTAKPIGTITKDIIMLIEEMKTTLVACKDPEGIGLAAPQVGKSLQLFIIKEDEKSPFSVFINPVVTLQEIPKEKEALRQAQGKKDDILEGCLSLKNVWGHVRRAPKVAITYTTIQGKRITENYSGYFARIIQHENDHLHGILFPRRVLEQNGTLYKSRKNAKGEEEFVPIEL